MKIQNRSGFTLLELLIVVIIIGVLASLAIPQFAAAVDRSRETEGVNILSAILTGEMVNYQEATTFVAAVPDSVTIPGTLHDWATPPLFSPGNLGPILDGIAGGTIVNGVTVTLNGNLGPGSAHTHAADVTAAAAPVGSHGVRGIVVSTGAKRIQRHRPADAAGLWTNF